MAAITPENRLQAADPRLEVRYLPPAELKPFANNARAHPRRQVDQIVASIRRYGFVNPILIDEEGEIIAGHGRLRAANVLGLEQVPTICLPRLSEAHKRALRLADNKIALNAGWDADLLKIELQSIAELEVNFDFGSMGFSVTEIDMALNATARANDDWVPTEPTTPTSQADDIWVLGDHRLGCGDCRDLGFLRRVVGPGPVSAAFLDPPYNVQIRGFAVGRRRHAEFAVASGELTTQQFRDFLRKTLGACVEVSRPGSVHFVCIDHRHVEDLIAACEGIYHERLNICVWNKSNGGMGSLYRSKHELVLVMKVGDAPHTNNVQLGRHGRNRTNVWDYAGVNAIGGARRDDLELHPTTKPVQLVADALCDVTDRNDTSCWTPSWARARPS